MIVQSSENCTWNIRCRIDSDSTLGIGFAPTELKVWSINNRSCMDDRSIASGSFAASVQVIVVRPAKTSVSGTSRLSVSV